MMDIGKGLQDAYEHGRQDALTELMEYTYGMLTAEKFGLQHKIKSMMTDRCFHKTESDSEKPNTCETCKWGEWYRKGYDITMMDDECGGCCSWNSKWTPKDEPHHSGEATEMVEPQTEETEMERLERIDNDLEDAWARIRELTDEPQTEDEILREQCRAFMGIVEQTERSE